MPGTVGHFDTLEDADHTARRILLNDTGAFDQEHERLGTAIHDRHFAAIELNLDVINPATGQRCHDVLDGTDGHTVLVTEDRAQPCVDDTIPARRDHRAGTLDVGAAEDNAGVDRRRVHGHGNFVAGVEADPGAVDRRFQRPLTNHRLIRVQSVGPRHRGMVVLIKHLFF